MTPGSLSNEATHFLIRPSREAIGSWWPKPEKQAAFSHGRCAIPDRFHKGGKAAFPVTILSKLLQSHYKTGAIGVDNFNVLHDGVWPLPATA